MKETDDQNLEDALNTEILPSDDFYSHYLRDASSTLNNREGIEKEDLLPLVYLHYLKTKTKMNISELPPWNELSRAIQGDINKLLEFEMLGRPNVAKTGRMIKKLLQDKNYQTKMIGLYNERCEEIFPHQAK